MQLATACCEMCCLNVKYNYVLDVGKMHLFTAANQDMGTYQNALSSVYKTRYLLNGYRIFTFDGCDYHHFLYMLSDEDSVGYVADSLCIHCAFWSDDRALPSAHAMMLSRITNICPTVAKAKHCY